MRIGLLAIGLLFMFTGLAIISLSRTPTVTKNENRVLIAQGLGDATEISDVNLVKNERFVVRYSGGGKYVNPEDILVNIFDPNNNITEVSYMSQYQNGMIANYTGSYRIQMGAPGLIDPESPFLMLVDRIEDNTRVEYNNSYILPYGLGALAMGTWIAFWGARSSKHRISHDKGKGRIR